MKGEAKLTSKGQITVSVDIRKAMGVETGNSIAFEIEGGEVKMVPVRAAKESPFAKYRPIGNPGMRSGLENIDRHLREFRVHDSDGRQWEEAYDAESKLDSRKQKSA